MKKKNEMNLQSCGLADLQTTKTLTRHFVTPSPKGRGARNAFTLAEVLITLGIIGVVAAMTIPTLVANYQQRSMDTAANVFNRKLGEALKVMNSNSSLAGYNSTEDFVKELGKHIKIVKTCDSEHLTSCFVSEFSTNEDTYKTEELKQAKNLNKDGNYGTETIGVQFADGVTALVAYNKNAKQDPFNNRVVDVTSSGTGKDLSIGLGTDALAILYDVSGSSNPNTYTNEKDIRGINIILDTSPEILFIDINYPTISCYGSISNDIIKYCGKAYTGSSWASGYSTDYWAGAQKICDEAGMRLPTKSELFTTYETLKASGEISSSGHGYFWSSTELENGNANAYIASFYNGSISTMNKSASGISTICVK